MKDVFQELADGLDGIEALDRYGEGDYLFAFEAEVAKMFGKPAAVFLPSGVMAQQIADLFDSLYVSFYKDLGGLCGSMLLGSEDFIQEAKLWQVCYGGRLFTQAPFFCIRPIGDETRSSTDRGLGRTCPSSCCRPVRVRSVDSESQPAACEYLSVVYEG